MRWIDKLPSLLADARRDSRRQADKVKAAYDALNEMAEKADAYELIYNRRKAQRKVST